jgi:hypothetical protein
MAADDQPLAGYTVADLAKRWRISPDKVRGFLRRGELLGINVATHRCSKPQWRITPESVRAFEAGRTSAPPPKPARRRRRAAEVDYFPD